MVQESKTAVNWTVREVARGTPNGDNPRHPGGGGTPGHPPPGGLQVYNPHKHWGFWRFEVYKWFTRGLQTFTRRGGESTGRGSAG
jgi:hypothetical protein